MYSCLLYGLLAHVWLLIGWFSNPRDEIEIVAGIATVVASGGSLTQSINQLNHSFVTNFNFGTKRFALPPSLPLGAL